MSWASRRRFTYLSGVILFFAIIIGIPLALWLYKPASCFDGKQNQEETAVDKGGPCRLLDERRLIPHAILWARSFEARDGIHSAVAYIENPNDGAGVRSVSYRFTLYDERNILVAERRGEAFIMPGGITPVFEGGISTGNRTATRAYFEFTESLVWERMENAATALVVRDKNISDVATMPRLSTEVENISVTDILKPTFVAVVFDTAGNAIAASRTELTRLDAGESRDVVFTWPDAFLYVAGRLDVLPLLPPEFSQS